MDTFTDHDKETLELLDFDPESEADCYWEDKPATWRLTARCCKSEWLMCDEHRQAQLRRVRERKVRTVCEPCGFTWWPRDVINHVWDKL